MSITITGSLFDTNMNRALVQAPIGFSDGTHLVTTRTDGEGAFSLALPHDGTWILAPHPQYNTFYAFTPIFVIAEGEKTDLKQVEVQGDNAANAQMLQSYVSNVLSSCQDLFEARIAKFDPLKLTEEEVESETAYIYNILRCALDPIAKGVTVPASDPAHSIPGPDQPPHMPMTAISCTTCRKMYANNQAALQNCLCCPMPCTNP